MSLTCPRAGLCCPGAAAGGRKRVANGDAAGSGRDAGVSLWFATNPSKRWGEWFFMIYTPFWLTLCLGIVVPYKLYEVRPQLLLSVSGVDTQERTSLFYFFWPCSMN